MGCIATVAMWAHDVAAASLSVDAHGSVAVADVHAALAASLAKPRTESVIITVGDFGLWNMSS